MPGGADNPPQGDAGGDQNSAEADAQSPGSEPGFGDSAGGSQELPSLIDDVPTPSASSSASASSGGASSDSAADSSAAQSGQSGGATGSQSQTAGESTASGANTAASDSVGTRASGGLEPDWGNADDAMTTAERVAILDKQLEQSTGVFDAILRDERAQQRETQRSQGASQPAGSAVETSTGRNPYETADTDGYGSVGGGIGGRSGGAPPENRTVYEAPDDIPDGNDDDVVARQLREAAMREPDPEVRERLWNEYRKYKGLEIPEE